MNDSRLHKNNLSEFMTYLAGIPDSADQRIPPLTELSKQLGISVATLREQLEVARMLGVVVIKPKAGIKKLSYNFKATLMTGLSYAVEADALSFEKFSDYRKHLEAAYFIEAAHLLTSREIEQLSGIVHTAQSKLSHNPGQIPAAEHREFHLLMYKKLENPYVTGMLEAYWEIYRIAGLDVYSDLNYAERVWQYHEKIIEQLDAGNYNQALKYLLEHMDLVNQRVKVQPRLSFE